MVPHCCQLIFRPSQACTERGADQRLQENHDENGQRKIDFVHSRHRRDAHEPRICTEAVSSAIAADDTVSGPHGPVPQWGDPNRKCIKPIRPGPRLLFWELTTQARLQIESAQKGPGPPGPFRWWNAFPHRCHARSADDNRVYGCSMSSRHALLENSTIVRSTRPDHGHANRSLHIRTQSLLRKFGY